MDAALAKLQPAPREPRPEWKPTKMFMNTAPTDSKVEAVSTAYKGLANFRRGVVDPIIARCLAWIEKHLNEAGFKILSCSTFGSHCYGLELGTSDVDIAVVLAPGQNKERFVEEFRALSIASPKFTCRRRCQRDDCHQTEFQGLPVDVKPIKETRASDSACRSTDMLKFLIEQRSGGAIADRPMVLADRPHSSPSAKPSSSSS